MIFASMHLLNDSTNAGAIVANDYEKVLRNKPHLLIRRHYLNMRESLPVCAYFILALYDKDTSIVKDAMRFFSAVNI